MIDKIVTYVSRHAVYMSDIYPYENYIGYQTESGKIVLY